MNTPADPIASCPFAAGAGQAEEQALRSTAVTGAAAACAASEYARYMRTDDLLSLQRPDADLLHRDERLFQCVHQSTELWLKQAVFEVVHAVDLIEQGRIATAVQILERAAACVGFTTDQVKLLARMSSFDFGRLRPALGQGSGLESPGWSGLRQEAARLYDAFKARCARERLLLGDVFRTGPEQPLYGLAEALLNLDAQVSVWRVEHLFITVRTIGTGGVGTKGMPVQSLAKLLSHRLYAELWEARSETAGA